MARIRTIKPEFPQSESMGRVSREARLCFIMIWTICDDSGRVRGNSRMLASLLYPYDDDAPKLMERWLKELEAENCIRRYKIGNDSYLESTNWLKHQKIDKPSASRIPAFIESSRSLANSREASTTYLVPSTLDQDLGPVPSTKTPAALFVLPDFIPNTAWEDFMEMRRKNRKPATEKAKALLATSLEKLMIAGDDPAEILNQSTLNGWTDVYPLKHKGNGHGRQGNGKQSAHDKFFEGVAGYIGSLDAGASEGEADSDYTGETRRPLLSS